MRLLSCLSLVLLLAALSPTAADELNLSSAERGAIKSVIERQIAAFATDDAATAFSLASPAIQHQFGSAEIFMRMVESGYRAVYHPRSVSFREARRIDTSVMQEVDVIGPDGLGVRAFYLMEREGDGSWRVGGVSLAPSNEKET